MKVRKRSIKKFRKYTKRRRCLRRFSMTVTLVEHFDKPISDIIAKWAKLIEPMIEKD